MLGSGLCGSKIPSDRLADRTYSALASAPLFTAKFFVGGLSGTLLSVYCTGDPPWPDPGACAQGGMVWAIIGLVCATSPVLLILCDSCVRQPMANDEDGGEREALVEKDGAGGDGSASDGEGGERSSLMPRK